MPTDKADERLRALPILFSEPVATHRRLLRNKLRSLVDQNRFLTSKAFAVPYGRCASLSTRFLLSCSFFVFQAGGKSTDFSGANLYG